MFDVDGLFGFNHGTLYLELDEVHTVHTVLQVISLTFICPLLSFGIIPLSTNSHKSHQKLSHISAAEWNGEEIRKSRANFVPFLCPSYFFPLPWSQIPSPLQDQCGLAVCLWDWKLAKCILLAEMKQRRNIVIVFLSVCPCMVSSWHCRRDDNKAFSRCSYRRCCPFSPCLLAFSRSFRSVSLVVVEG